MPVPDLRFHSLPAFPLHLLSPSVRPSARATMTIEYLTQLFDRTENEKHTTVQQATEFLHAARGRGGGFGGRCATANHVCRDVMIFFFATGDAFMTSYINQPRSLRRTARLREVWRERGQDDERRGRDGGHAAHTRCQCAHPRPASIPLAARTTKRGA